MPILWQPIYTEFIKRKLIFQKAYKCLNIKTPPTLATQFNHFKTLCEQHEHIRQLLSINFEQFNTEEKRISKDIFFFTKQNLNKVLSKYDLKVTCPESFADPLRIDIEGIFAEKLKNFKKEEPDTEIFSISDFFNSVDKTEVPIIPEIMANTVAEFLNNAAKILPDFDGNPENLQSALLHDWYFGPMTRQEATEVLMNERERGVFLVRDSNSIVGDYVLCVREDTKVSNYIINKIQQDDQIIYRIGDQSFENLPKLLTFYTLHYLDTTPLRHPAQKKLERVIGKFDFEGSDQDDLPFRRGEILTVIRKDEDQWWTARNALGQVGSVPVPYIQKYDDYSEESNMESTSCGAISNHMKARSSSACDNMNTTNCLASNKHSLKRSDLNRKLPAYARVLQARHPNAYDKTALKLEVGDIIKVTKTNINGQWEGESKGKKGHFPFTHVEFMDDNQLGEQTNTDLRINKEWGE